MSHGASYSEEVAEDYRQSLEDLNINSRWEISNLTVIAKENTEHAHAISEALKSHIRQTAAAKKLPAFYVLDSVVKNVGTPYTIFLGRNLYSTFMEAYALVDNNVRRKMDEMLKTWTVPVPGSLSTQPVFPIDVTRPIELALQKARTSAMQQDYAREAQQQQLMRGRPGLVQPLYRQTPTPPGMMRPGHYPPQSGGVHIGEAYGNGYGAAPYGQPTQAYAQQPRPYTNGEHTAYAPPHDNGYAQAPVHNARPASTTPSWMPPQPQAASSTRPEASIDTLNSDVDRLINVARSDFARSVFDQSVQTRLKALLDLQKLLQTTRLPPDQLAAVRAQVDALSGATPFGAVPSPRPAQLATLGPAAAPVPPQASTPGPTLTSLFGQGGLAALLARSSTTATPPPAQAQPALVPSPLRQAVLPTYNPTPIPPPISIAGPADAGSLLDRLRAAGILSSNTTPVPAIATPVPSLVTRPGLPQQNFQQLGTQLPFFNLPTSLSSSGPEIPNDVELTAASIKIPRPHLLPQLHARLGNPCTECGRRFPSDVASKPLRDAHKDWHFHVKSRMADASGRGQHRSWYVDELDWIRSRESADGGVAASTNGIASTSAAPGYGISSSGNHAMGKIGGTAIAVGQGSVAHGNASTEIFLPVPVDPPNVACPICQERFEMKWLDAAQEFVWVDAVEHAGRVWHASCRREAGGDGGTAAAAARSAVSEMDGILGKRKNEDEHTTSRPKIKTEPGL